MKRSLAIALSLGVSAVAAAQATDAQLAEAQPTDAQPAHAQSADAPPADAQPAASVASPADAPAAAELGQLTEAELEALGFGGGENVQTVDTGIKVFGFADFGTTTPVNHKSSRWYGSFYDKHRSMYVGNLNLYVSKNLTEAVRTMAEVRFLYLPHGAQDQATGAVTSTATKDYSDFNRPLNWGGIEIERVYLDWDAFRHLTLRAGQFLTPYGIWNVDHGSPTFIPVQRPFVVGANWFPERQTGFELFGKVDLPSNQTIGYHATISNGQGLTAEYRDLDSNKALGGRAYWEWRALGMLRVGASGYYGLNTDALYVPGIENGNVAYHEKIQTQYKNLALAADVLWKYKGLRLQFEVLNQQLKYTEAGRVQVTSVLTGRTNFPIDLRSWGGYLLAGYRFDWFGVMPYAVLQHINQVSPSTGLITKMNAIDVGLNVRPIESVVVKASYQQAHFPDGFYVTKDDIKMFQFQVAWAF